MDAATRRWPGRARVAQAQGELQKAMGHVEVLLARRASGGGLARRRCPPRAAGPAIGSWPAQATARAAEILASAHAELQARAATISDAALRRGASASATCRTTVPSPARVGGDRLADGCSDRPPSVGRRSSPGAHAGASCCPNIAAIAAGWRRMGRAVGAVRSTRARMLPDGDGRCCRAAPREWQPMAGIHSLRTSGGRQLPWPSGLPHRN